jgi:deoxyribonuclease V
MKPVLKHKWNLTPRAAAQLQSELSAKVSYEPAFDDAREAHTVLAMDVGYAGRGGAAKAAAVLMSLPELKVLESVLVVNPAEGLFPYVPGLLSFREIPSLLKALAKVRGKPDVLLVNGHGLAHPRRFGLATHLGLLFDLPSVGCASDPLTGEFEEPPPGLPGSYTFLRVGDSPVGAALRTRPGVAPVFVSPGHRMDIVTAVDIVMNCVRGHRWPEPLRLADQLPRRPGGASARSRRKKK